MESDDEDTLEFEIEIVDSSSSSSTSACTSPERKRTISVGEAISVKDESELQPAAVISALFEAAKEIDTRNSNDNETGAPVSHAQATPNESIADDNPKPKKTDDEAEADTCSAVDASSAAPKLDSPNGEPTGSSAAQVGSEKTDRASNESLQHQELLDSADGKIKSEEVASEHGEDAICKVVEVVGEKAHEDELAKPQSAATSGESFSNEPLLSLNATGGEEQKQIEELELVSNKAIPVDGEQQVSARQETAPRENVADKQDNHNVSNINSASAADKLDTNEEVNDIKAKVVVDLRKSGAEPKAAAAAAVECALEAPVEEACDEANNSSGVACGNTEELGAAGERRSDKEQQAATKESPVSEQPNESAKLEQVNYNSGEEKNQAERGEAESKRRLIEPKQTESSLVREPTHVEVSVARSLEVIRLKLEALTTTDLTAPPKTTLNLTAEETAELEVEQCERVEVSIAVEQCNAAANEVAGVEQNAGATSEVSQPNAASAELPAISIEPASAPTQTASPGCVAPQSDEDLEREFDNEPPFERRQVEVKRRRDVREEYELADELGRGKFGTVLKCKELASGRFFAAKFVRMRRREDREDVEREVHIMSLLQHKRLLQLYDAFDDGLNEMCLVCELVEGGELFERVVDDDFELTEKKAAVFMRQIVEGVEYMHGQSIVHLDMKPENILCVSKSGYRIKLIDFGLARQLRHDEQLRVMFGTPDFAAPEVLAYDIVSLATDMWSVGVICYVLLSGLSPFMGDNDMETMANVTRATYDFEDDAFEPISDLAKDFISKLLVREQSKRLKPNECLQHPWLQRGGRQLEAAVRGRRESLRLNSLVQQQLQPLDLKHLEQLAAQAIAAGANADSSATFSLDKKNLKKYVVRRKWHKTVHAIMALGRMGANLKFAKLTPTG